MCFHIFRYLMVQIKTHLSLDDFVTTKGTLQYIPLEVHYISSIKRLEIQQNKIFSLSMKPKRLREIVREKLAVVFAITSITI